MTSAVTPTEEQTITVEVSQPTSAITSGGLMRTSVAVSLTAPAEYVEVRLRLRSPSGRLVYQKTEVRSGLPAGRHVVEYERDLSDLDLPQGRYPIDVRVLATGAVATTAASRLLVLDADTPTLPVAVVVSVSGIPAVTMSGRFARDPDDGSRLLEDLGFVTRLARDRRVPLALAIPPVLVEQYARAAAGYETTAGVPVPASGEQALHSARVLQGLRSAVATGTIGLVDVPYALPDLPGLARIGGDADLGLHWTRSDEVMAATLRPAAQPKIAYIGPHLSSAAITSLTERGASCVLAPASAIRSGDATATPGCYSLDADGVRVLVVDERAAEGARTGAAEFYDALFDRLEGGPVVVMLDIGSGDADSVIAVQHALDWIDAAPWLRAAEIDTLSPTSRPPAARIAALPEAGAPSGYWPDIALARTATLAYVSSTEPGDVDASTALRALLVSESSLWHGEDGGLALAREALDFVTGQFSLIVLDSKDVTLSGSKGNVPLTLINDTGKQLNLTVHAASSSGLSVAPAQDVVVQPTQNFLTIPVDLGNALEDDLKVTVRAGDVIIAEADVGVRASYIDQLATILMVVIVLAVLLVFIRRRVGSALAGTMQDDSTRPGGAAARK